MCSLKPLGFNAEPQLPDKDEKIRSRWSTGQRAKWCQHFCPLSTADILEIGKG